MYTLDSDSVTLFLHHKGQQPQLVRRVLDVPADQMWVSVITVKEIIGGAMALVDNPKRSSSAFQDCAFLRQILRDLSDFQILPYDDQARQIFNNMTAAEKRVGGNDCKIAASAIARGFTVITRNIKDFAQISGVQYEDWTQK